MTFLKELDVRFIQKQFRNNQSNIRERLIALANYESFVKEALGINDNWTIALDNRPSKP